MELGLQGKYVFISGSTKGIGLATAEAFLSEGAVVMLNGRDSEKLEAETERLSESYPGQVFGALGDITTEKGIQTVTKKIKHEFPQLDVFVANLGNGKAETQNILALSEWKRFYEINVLGNIGILGALHPMLVNGSNSSVLFLSSIVARESASAPCGYAAAKSAVLTLAKYLSKQWASDGIRVNCVLPGNIYFEGGRWEELKQADEEAVSSYIIDKVAMKRFGTPQEIADAILFLASERAGFITGASLVVDGGQVNTV